ncbi:hypothetical protein [Kribbella sp. NPDC051620]|uniref:hypothetical protein n=1 Tax=Kribbella sp. NPDC051620 TaxID=3364120 RepID=UPI0037B3A2DA
MNKRIELLADGVWTFAADDHRCLFAEADESVVVINALAGGAATDALREAIAATVPGKPISHIVHAIDHLDHVGGSAQLAPDATGVAHDLCAAVLAGRSESPIHRRVFGTGETMEVDGLRLQLAHPGPSQGTGNLAVTIAGTGVLFIVGPRADARYGLLNDFHFRHATRVWRELVTDDVTIVVPGRGPVMDADGLCRAADYIDALADATQHAFADGVPIWVYEAMEPYVRERLAPMYGALDGFDDHVGIAAIRIVHYYLMGGWGLEDTAAPPLTAVQH